MAASETIVQVIGINIHLLTTGEREARHTGVGFAYWSPRPIAGYCPFRPLCRAHKPTRNNMDGRVQGLGHQTSICC